ncbi:MAG: DUF2157 domain-containing protein [Chitinophagaceae bacterium]|nr:DUF2157 domain-containing protein [Chitinophagaceae bacterium]
MVRSFLHLLAANSRWPVAAMQETLEKEIYADKKSWHKFIKGLILSLGLGFFVAGVVFFFAFNWEHLHRFAKLGLVQGLFLILAGLAFALRNSQLLHRLLLTAAAVMIGVIFAVFGQIYQTGANAYDFFFSWWLFVLVWSVYLLFEPMWLLLITLANITLYMFMEQETTYLTGSLAFIAFIALNVLFYIIIMLIRQYRKELKANWLVYLLTVYLAGVMSFGFTIGLYAKWDNYFLVLVVLEAVLLLTATWYSLRKKDIFLLTIVGLSGMIIVLDLINKIRFSEFSFLLSGLWIIGSLTLLVKQLVQLQKKWRNE